MSKIVFEKWFWITVVSALLIVVLPLIIVWSILTLPAELRIVATVGLVILWGVFSGYKDWLQSQQKKEQATGSEA
jgi:hypothetical protein